LTVDQALEHPFVKEFRNTDEEITCLDKISFEMTEEEKTKILDYREEGMKKLNELRNSSFVMTRENTKKSTNTNN
jgi:hypothetical protein